MSRTFFRIIVAALVIGLWSPLAALADRAKEGEGRGVDSQLLWPVPGPSHFAAVQSSDIVPHKNIAFSTLLDYYRKPIGIVVDGENEWIVENAFVGDFMWAFGIVDLFQIGLALPLVLEQSGVGMEPVQPDGTPDADYMLSSSALRDIRFNFKTRFLGGDAEIPDQRDLGLALDVGLSVPSGDEMSFAGDGGVVLFPTLVLDFHRCMFSATANLGARFRFDQDISLANEKVGQQGVFALGATGHFLKRRLLVSGELAGVVEFDGFDRVGVEYRANIGYVADENRNITIWLGAGTASGTGDLLGTPKVRALIGLTYAPQRKDPSCCDYKY